MWNFKDINYICRIITDKDEKFKFDLLLRTNILITDGKSYDTFADVCKALSLYLEKMYEYDNNPNLHGANHLIVNQTIFE